MYSRKHEAALSCSPRSWNSLCVMAQRSGQMVRQHWQRCFIKCKLTLHVSWRTTQAVRAKRVYWGFEVQEMRSSVFAGICKQTPLTEKNDCENLAVFSLAAYDLDLTHQTDTAAFDVTSVFKTLPFNSFLFISLYKMSGYRSHMATESGEWESVG